MSPRSPARCARAASSWRGAVVGGLSDPKRGGGTVFGIFDHPGVNHHPALVTGVLEAEAKAILQGFFRERRT